MDRMQKKIEDLVGSGFSDRQALRLWLIGTGSVHRLPLNNGSGNVSGTDII